MNDIIRNILTFTTGGVLTALDFIKLGTGVIGLVGAILMAIAGYYTFQTKRLERDIKAIELERLKEESTK